MLPCFPSIKVRALSKGAVKTHLADLLKAFPSLKNAKIWNSLEGSSKTEYKSSSTPFFQRSQNSDAKDIVTRTPPLFVPYLHKPYQDHDHQNPHEIKVHLPDLLRSFQHLKHGLQDVLSNNRRWADTQQLREMRFFDNLKNEPKLYWIGESFFGGD